MKENRREGRAQKQPKQRAFSTRVDDQLECGRKAEARMDIKNQKKEKKKKRLERWQQLE